MSDITFGEAGQLRGHWADRLADIDADIAAIEAKPAQKQGAIARAITEALGHPQRPPAAGRHTALVRFQPGSALALEFAALEDYSSRGSNRHVNHAERWQDKLMQSAGRIWRSAVPSEYTQGPYPLQYYFELKEAPDRATLYPGFNQQLIGQPYFLVRQG